ncbi:RNA polymerase sigma factor [Novosphingobium sp. Gsoil 351]|uniref:RNA polymerase sigma factor n=1 Tax=Novosphingobium sp. Gsoil 351 TaxID=2675225 RepID=UPI0012B4496A|nr:sigma-70 family RNA polymerase sigma factor [Novosphingobium sp. Gsoil 351]QGN54061.1 sigma-70 family RNA polymerase sigma factor [Novosphingobium sp. Gsoil 351]
MNASFSPTVAADECGDPSGTAPSNTTTASALERLYRTQSARLRRYFARRTGSDDAGDLVQETFVRFAGAAADGQAAVDCPEAYLTRVATNLLRDRARTAAHNALYLQQQAVSAAGRYVDPHPLLESRDALRGLEQALARLNPRRRKIFLLHRLEDMTYAEIGAAVGMSEKGVKKQMAKALLELRQATDPSA